jgi:hypothetical protein
MGGGRGLQMFKFSFGLRENGERGKRRGFICCKLEFLLDWIHKVLSLANEL